HDIELAFAEVRTLIVQLIQGESREQRIHFCLDQGYQPLPDVHIEHGNQYDFWNYARGIWDTHGKALTPRPADILLPLGRQYMYRAGLAIYLRSPYFYQFNPPIGNLRRTAILSLIDPEVVIQTVQHIIPMMSYAYQDQTSQGLARGDTHIPVQLFELAMS